MNRPSWRWRFAAVGTLTTVVDVGTLLLLARVGSVPVALADVVALALAAALSFVAHRAVTFARDPKVRWVELPAAFVATAVVAGAVDLLVLQGLVSAGTLDEGGGLFWEKVVAVAVAAVVRGLAYRWVLFTVIRRDLAERAARPPAPGAVRLTLVIPAYGDASVIGGTVERARRELADVATDGGLEIVVVDDGSTDGTADAARAAGADQVVVHPQNRGKGAAVRSGVAVAHGRTVAFTDADLAYAPAQAARLLTEVEAGWDVVVASRQHPDTTTVVKARALREVGGRVINLTTHAVLLGQHRDTQAGLKAFRSDVARLLFEKSTIDGFAFDVELFHLVERYRLSLEEVPVAVANTSRSTVHVVRDATRLLRDLVRIRRAAARGAYDPAPGELEALEPTAS